MFKQFQCAFQAWKIFTLSLMEFDIELYNLKINFDFYELIKP